MPTIKDQARATLTGPPGGGLAGSSGHRAAAAANAGSNAAMGTESASGSPAGSDGRGTGTDTGAQNNCPDSNDPARSGNSPGAGTSTNDMPRDGLNCNSDPGGPNTPKTQQGASCPPRF